MTTESNGNMTALNRVTRILERARVNGGWIDETVAAAVLEELNLDANGEPLVREPTSSNLGHG